MNFEWFIGIRYLTTRTGEAFISLISLLSLAGVTLGVTALIVVIAVMSGAEADLQQRILAVQPHVMVGQYGGRLNNPEAITRQLRQMREVTRVSPVIFAQIMLRSRKAMAGAVLKGVQPSEETLIIGPELAARMQARRSGPDGGPAQIPGLVLGKVLAETLAVTTGDTVNVMVVDSRRTATRRLPAMQQVTVIGLFDSGMYDYDKQYACLHLAEAQQVLKMPDSVSGIELQVTEPFGAAEVAGRIGARLGYPFYARDWMQTNRNMFVSLRLQKTVMFIILILIVLVAAFSITSTLVMRVKRKTRDIAILKALGATPRRIRRVFMVTGMLISAVGTGLGTAIGFGICMVLKHYPIIELPADVYYFTSLPVRLELRDVLIIVGATLLISLVATILPARRAAALHPVDGLRAD
jgi:lipoprotein-releasing system permease protein